MLSAWTADRETRTSRWPDHSRNPSFLIGPISASIGAPMPVDRRSFLTAAAASASGAAAAGLACPAVRANEPPRKERRFTNRIAVSTYSYWRFRDDSRVSIERCIDLAAEAGFDGVEILHVQMRDESNGGVTTKDCVNGSGNIIVTSLDRMTHSMLFGSVIGENFP